LSGWGREQSRHCLQRALDRAQFITKRKLLHLAHRIARQLLEDIERPRPLVACEAIRKELFKTLKTRFGFVRKRNDCCDPLALFIIGQTDDGHLRDGGGDKVAMLPSLFPL